MIEKLIKKYIVNDNDSGLYIVAKFIGWMGIIGFLVWAVICYVGYTMSADRDLRLLSVWVLMSLIPLFIRTK